MAEIRINTTGGLKLYDADNSHYAQILAGTITSNTDVMTLGHAAVVMGTKLDMNGSNLILDADADTYLDTGTDDTIKFYVSGAHDLTIGANAINVLSGTTLTIDSGATITNSGTANGFGSSDPSSADGDSLGTASAEWSDLYLADGGVVYLGNDQDVTLTHVADTGVLLNGANVIQFRDSGLTIGSNADGDLDIVSDGTAVDSINLESAGGITLDAGTAGSGIVYEDDGTEMARIHNSSSDVIIESKVSDKDIIIKGNDGGSTVTALTFDMSNKGSMTLGAHGQIKFPASQNASSDANTLDDYEEGTFTGGFSFGGSATGISYNRQVGIYTKIGNLVFVQGYISLTSKGSQTGVAQITGLPFTSSSASNASSAGNMRVAQLTFADETHLSLHIESGGVVLTFGDTTSGSGSTNMDNTNFADNTGIEFGFTYTV